MKKLTIALLSMIFIGNVNAVIIGAVGVDVSAIDTSAYGTNNGSLIDQSGLSANYTSGVDDFTAFTSTTTASYDTSLTNYGLGGVAGLGSFYFDLGEIFNVDAIATWGQDCCSATLLTYDLYASDIFGAAGSRTLIGSFTAGTSPNAYAHLFNSVETQFLEIDATSNGGYTAATRLNEVVFGGSTASVPEPSSMILLMLGLAGIGFTRRKQNS